MENLKHILDFAAYPSFTNKNRTADQLLTKKVVVQSTNGQFLPTHKTTIPVDKSHGTTKVPALRHDGLRHHLLATHDMLNDIEPILLISYSVRVMETNEHNGWMKTRSTKLASKTYHTYMPEI